MLPSRRAGRRRDRHGRGLRGPLVPPTVPGYRTRTDRFDDAVAAAVARMDALVGNRLSGVEFAVEDVPPSNPAPWEHDAVALGRYFPADIGLAHRIVLYRRPLLGRVVGEPEMHELIQRVLTEQVAHLLGRAPEDIDPDY
ncbi:peptidase [Pseudactinotalea sp. HY160]|nr:peptidase [Pseudactinotalea sp. HY160]QGH70936.1 peptidase [Pseudactinotalea sp. HY158]